MKMDMEVKGIFMTILLLVILVVGMAFCDKVFAGAAGGNNRPCWNHVGLDLGGFELVYGTVPGTYTNIIDVGMAQPGSASGNTQDFCSGTFLELGVPEGDWYWNVRSYDAVGNKSGFNGEVDTIPLDLTPSSDPTALIIASQ